MSVNARTPDKGNATDPRPRNIFLGVDSEGLHHVYQTRLKRVIIVDPQREYEGRQAVQPLGGKTVDDWMSFIEGKRGWDDRRYGVSLAEMIVDSLEDDQ